MFVVAVALAIGTVVAVALAIGTVVAAIRYWHGQ